jgi:L-ribulokinase
MAAGTFRTIEEAQDKICPGHRTFSPDSQAQHTYEDLYPLYSRLYFSLGQPSNASGLGSILPTLIAVAEAAARQKTASIP